MFAVIFRWGTKIERVMLFNDEEKAFDFAWELAKENYEDELPTACTHCCNCESFESHFQLTLGANYRWDSLMGWAIDFAHSDLVQMGD